MDVHIVLNKLKHWGQGGGSNCGQSCIVHYQVKDFRTILIYVFTFSSSQQFCTTAYILVPQVHNVYISALKIRATAEKKNTQQAKVRM